MLSQRLIVIGFSTLLLVGIGCSNKESNRVNNDSSKTVANQTLEVKMRGNFKRSFEIHELESNGKIYYVADPKQLLIKSLRAVEQDGYYKSFETCLVGVIGSKGGYGPTGRYENEIIVNDLCV